MTRSVIEFFCDLAVEEALEAAAALVERRDGSIPDRQEIANEIRSLRSSLIENNGGPNAIR